MAAAPRPRPRRRHAAAACAAALVGALALARPRGGAGAWLVAPAGARGPRGGAAAAPRRAGAAAGAPPAAPEHYHADMRGTAEGGAFWRRTTDQKWGEFAEGEGGAFDKDDLVEAVFTVDGEWYSGQIMKYVGDGSWIVMWLDDLPEGSEEIKASTVVGKNIRHMSYTPVESAE